MSPNRPGNPWASRLHVFNFNHILLVWTIPYGIQDRFMKINYQLWLINGFHTVHDFKNGFGRNLRNYRSVLTLGLISPRVTRDHINPDHAF